MVISERADEVSIGEIARRAGVKPSTIRYYESIGLLPEPSRVAGRRRYDQSVLSLLALIDVAQRAGFSLAEIRTLIHGFSPNTPPAARWRELAERKLPEVDALIARAGAMRRLLEEGLACGCLSLDQCALLIAGGQLPDGRNAPPR